MENERFIDFGHLLLQRKAEMPEGSATVRELQEGPPKIIAKEFEEMGEVSQALFEQDGNQVNREISQAMYHLLVAGVYWGKLDIEGVATEFERKKSFPRNLEISLGLAFRNCGQSMGLAYSALMSVDSTNQEVNSRIADVMINFQDAMQIAGKGSWDAVVEKLWGVKQLLT